MYRVLARLAVLSAALIMATPCLADPQPNPHVDVSAIHLGGGQIQYTILLNNPSGGSAGANVTAVGNFNQIDTTANFLRLLEPGPVDTFFEANLATAFDPLVYGAANGLVNDSYWDDSGLSIAIGVDGVTGGEVGSMVFSFNAMSLFGSDISNTRLAQLVVFDPASTGTLIPASLPSTHRFTKVRHSTHRPEVWSSARTMHVFPMCSVDSVTRPSVWTSPYRQARCASMPSAITVQTSLVWWPSMLPMW